MQYFQGYCVSFKQALGVMPFFIGIELIHKSSCSHSFDELTFFYYKRVICSHSFFQVYCVFGKQEFQQGDTNNNSNISLVSGMHVLKKVCYMTTSFTAIHFFYDSVFISREHLKKSTCQGNCVYFTTLFATIHYNKRSVVDSRKS